MKYTNHKKGPLDTKLQLALGSFFLIQFLNGKTIKQIALDQHHQQSWVKKRMKKAADLLIDEAHQTILSEVFPEGVRVYKAFMDQQLKKAANGQDIDIEAVERLMKGMFIFDSPQLKDTQLAKQRAELGAGEEDSLASLMRVRRASLPRVTVEVPNANESQAPVRTEAGVHTPESVHVEREGEAHSDDQVGREDLRGEGSQRVASPTGPEETDSHHQ